MGVSVFLQAHDATADSRATKIVGTLTIVALRVAVVGLSVGQSLQVAYQLGFRMESEGAVAQPVNCAVQDDLRSRRADIRVSPSEE